MGYICDITKRPVQDTSKSVYVIKYNLIRKHAFGVNVYVYLSCRVFQMSAQNGIHVKFNLGPDIGLRVFPRELVPFNSQSLFSFLLKQWVKFKTTFL